MPLTMPPTVIAPACLISAVIVASTISANAAAHTPRTECSLSRFKEGMLKGYDEAERPGLWTGDPVVVRPQMYVSAVGKLDQQRMQLQLHGYWRLYWNDSRLAFNETVDREDVGWPEGQAFPKSIDFTNDAHRIWYPDIYFENAVNVEWGDKDAQMLTVSASGKVFWSRQLAVTFHCSMLFEHMPFDTQTCVLEGASYRYPSADLLLRIFEHKAVDLSGEMREQTAAEEPEQGMPQWRVSGVDGMMEVKKFTVGYWEYIQIAVTAERKWQRYMVNPIFTAMLFNILSYTSYWIDRNLGPVRAFLTCLSILFTITLWNGAAAKLPNIAYMTWLDTYLIGVLCLNVIPFLEFALVHFLNRREKKFMSKKMNVKTWKEITASRNSQQHKAVVPMVKAVASALPNPAQPPSHAAPQAVPTAGTGGDAFEVLASDVSGIHLPDDDEKRLFGGAAAIELESVHWSEWADRVSASEEHFSRKSTATVSGGKNGAERDDSMRRVQNRAELTALELNMLEVRSKKRSEVPAGTMVESKHGTLHGTLPEDITQSSSFEQFCEVARRGGRFRAEVAAAAEEEERRGRHRDAEEGCPLPPWANTNFLQEDLRAIQKLFLTIDRDGSGRLETGEIRELFAQMSDGDKFSQEVIHAFDINFDNSVSWDEFIWGMLHFLRMERNPKATIVHKLQLMRVMLGHSLTLFYHKHLRTQKVSKQIDFTFRWVHLLLIILWNVIMIGGR